MNIILFENPTYRNQLKPITLTRPLAGIRIGILTIQEKWEMRIHGSVSYLTEDYLSHKFQVQYSEQNIYVNASYLPTNELELAIENLKLDECICKNNEIIAFKSTEKLNFGFDFKGKNCLIWNQKLNKIKELPDLFLCNADEILNDFEILTIGKKSATINDKFTAIYGKENIFIDENVSIKASILNAENGPIYIGKNAIIQEGSLIIGPVAIGEESMVAFGAKIRPNTTLGPVCRVGGEVGNSIFHGFSNKAHDGFLGNSYIGEWCNLGANTNNSNLKNDYKSVKLYNYDTDTIEDTNELFVGTFMGDYSKTGISTMFNTGTVMGVSANVFGAGFQDKFIPSFSWGGNAEGYENYRFEKATEVINATMKRRNTELSKDDLKILTTISNKHK